MSTSIRISVDVPDPKKTIEDAVKRNPVIERVSVSISSFGSSTVTCEYDEKKYASTDKYKLEKDLKAAIGALGYKVR